MALHAVVALRRAHLDELLRHINHINHEIRVLNDVAHRVATGEDKAVASLKSERFVIKAECAISPAAEGMGQIAREALVGNVGQGVFDDDVGTVVHDAKVSAKVTIIFVFLLSKIDYYACCRNKART